MPQKRNSTERPPVMTWKKAAPVLTIAAVFDALRIMFEFFWFFGPALTAFYCTVKVSDVVGTTAGGLLCGAGATALGFFAAPAITVFGVVMAMAVGFFGWLTVGLMVVMTNSRIFKDDAGNTLWFLLGLGIAEVPLVGTIPALTGLTYKMYRAQIKNDKKAIAQYEQSQGEERLREQRQQAAGGMQEARAAEQISADQEEAANDEAEQAANDEEYDAEEIPEEVRKAA